MYFILVPALHPKQSKSLQSKLLHATTLCYVQQHSSVRSSFSTTRPYLAIILLFSDWQNYTCFFLQRTHLHEERDFPFSMWSGKRWRERLIWQKQKCWELQGNKCPSSIWLYKFLSLYSYKCSVHFFNISHAHLDVLYKNWGKVNTSLYQHFQTEIDVIMIHHPQNLGY